MELNKEVEYMTINEDGKRKIVGGFGRIVGYGINRDGYKVINIHDDKTGLDYTCYPEAINPTDEFRKKYNTLLKEENAITEGFANEREELQAKWVKKARELQREVFGNPEYPNEEKSGQANE